MPLTGLISQVSSADTEFKILSAVYGDGYEQRAPDGLNYERDSWNVVWENVTTAELGTIMTALRATQGVDYINWTAPGDSVQKKWVVQGKIGRSAKSGGIYTVSCTLKQVFDLAPA